MQSLNEIDKKNELLSTSKASRECQLRLFVGDRNDRKDVQSGRIHHENTNYDFKIKRNINEWANKQTLRNCKLFFSADFVPYGIGTMYLVVKLNDLVYIGF